MGTSRSVRAVESEALALQASAGLAFGCAYSSSDEFDAALIAERRKAGAYGYGLRPAAWLGAGLMTALALLTFSE